MQVIILYTILAQKDLLNVIIKNQHKHVPDLEHHFDLKKHSSHVWVFILPHFLAFELYFCAVLYIFY